MVGEVVPAREVKAGARPYRGGSGQWAFVAHRVSGFLVFAFLLLHIVDVSLVRWPRLYDQVHHLYGAPLLRMFEVGLLFALLFHAFNGLRIVAIDLLPAAVASHRRILVAAVAGTIVFGLPGAFVIMAPVLFPSG